MLSAEKSSLGKGRGTVTRKNDDAAYQRFRSKMPHLSIGERTISSELIKGQPEFFVSTYDQKQVKQYAKWLKDFNFVKHEGLFRKSGSLLSPDVLTLLEVKYDAPSAPEERLRELKRSVTHPEQPILKAKMSDISREELDAKLQTVEARMDTRVAEVVGRIDVVLSEIRADRERSANLEKSLSEFRAESKSAERDMRAQTASLKTTMIVTAIATVIGLWGANIALSSLMQDSFSAGKEQGATLAVTAAEIKATQEKLKEHQEKLEKMLQSSPTK